MGIISAITPFLLEKMRRDSNSQKVREETTGAKEIEGTKTDRETKLQWARTLGPIAAAGVGGVAGGYAKAYYADKFNKMNKKRKDDDDNYWNSPPSGTSFFDTRREQYNWEHNKPFNAPVPDGTPHLYPSIKKEDLYQTTLNRFNEAASKPKSTKTTSTPKDIEASKAKMYKDVINKDYSRQWWKKIPYTVPATGIVPVIL